MDEKIQNLLGDAYKEGMSSEDVLKALTAKNLADLSTGKYVDKNKFEEREKAYKDLQKQLSEKMTEEEKNKAEIKRLEEDREKELSDLRKEVSRSKTEKVLVSSGLQEEDYKELLEKMVTATPNVAHEIAESVSKIILNVKQKAKKEFEDEIANKLKNPNSDKKNQDGNESDFAQFIKNQPKQVTEVKL